MPNRDGKGPPFDSKGLRDGRGQGRGRLEGKGTGKKQVERKDLVNIESLKFYF